MSGTPTTTLYCPMSSLLSSLNVYMGTPPRKIVRVFTRSKAVEPSKISTCMAEPCFFVYKRNNSLNTKGCSASFKYCKSHDMTKHVNVDNYYGSADVLYVLRCRERIVQMGKCARQSFRSAENVIVRVRGNVFVEVSGRYYRLMLLVIHTYIHTYIHTCMHTYIHTYVRTYIHTYIHT